MVNFYHEKPDNEIQREFLLAEASFQSDRKPIHYFQIDIARIWSTIEVMDARHRGIFFTLLLKCVIAGETGLPVNKLGKILNLHQKSADEVLKRFSSLLHYSQDRTRVSLGIAIDAINKVREISQKNRYNGLKNTKKNKPWLNGG